MDTQISSREILEQSLTLAASSSDHEHLYATIYKRPDQFRLYHFVCSIEEMWPELRLTLDTKEDFELISHVFQALYSKDSVFTLIDMIRYLKNNPDLVKINQFIPSKGLT
jgi:spore coat polysaccharide biosynthesis protein SpsF